MSRQSKSDAESRMSPAQGPLHVGCMLRRCFRWKPNPPLQTAHLELGSVAPVAEQPAERRDGALGGDGTAIGGRARSEQREDARRHERRRRVPYLTWQHHERSEGVVGWGWDGVLELPSALGTTVRGEEGEGEAALET